MDARADTHDSGEFVCEACGSWNDLLLTSIENSGEPFVCELCGHNSRDHAEESKERVENDGGGADAKSLRGGSVRALYHRLSRLSSDAVA